MKPGLNDKVYELTGSTIWLDENGILCSVAKNVEQSIEDSKKAMDQLRIILNGKKVCLLSDSTNASTVNKEIRDYAAEVIPEIAKAVAIMSDSYVGKMAANLFFMLKKQPYPVKFFDNEVEAKEWLKQYL